MLERQTLTTDILVVGSGIAGMIAAIEARRSGAQVILATKGNLGRESSTAFARTFQTNYGEQLMAGRQIPGYDDKPGKYLEEWPLISTIIEEGPKQIANLIELGVPFVKKSSHSLYERLPVYLLEGGDRSHGGAIVLDILAPRAVQMGVKAVEGCQVVGLLKDDGRVVGASGLLQNGQWLSMYAKAVVLASGGMGALPEVSSAPREVCGNGHAMALRAGLALKNMELSTFYPVGLPTPTGQFVHCAPLTLMMEKALLRNDAGEDIVRKHFGISLQEGVPISAIRFDWLPRAVALEMEKGRVWLDLTQVPESEWDGLPERNWKQIRRTHADLKKVPVAIKHLSQSSKGGLSVTTRMETSMDGLYGAGEVCAGWRALERCLSPLPSCLAMGAIAGRSAAADIEGKEAPRAEGPDEGLEEARALVRGGGQVSPAETVNDIRRVLYEHAGPVRSEKSLNEGIGRLQALEAKGMDFRCAAVQDLGDALEARAMLLAGRAVMQASLMRTESRGGFYRSDFPSRDDARWLRSILVSYQPGLHELALRPGDPVVTGTLGAASA